MTALTLTLVCALASLVVAGCGGDHRRAEPAEPAIGAVPVLQSDADIHLPMDDYLPTTAQTYTISRAINILGRACLRDFGMSWPATPPWVDDPQPRNARRYTVIDPARAATEGYHAVDLLNRHRMIAAQEAALPVTTADAQAIWSGAGAATAAGHPVPAGGCRAAAIRQLATGATVEDPDLAQRLHLLTFDQTKADSRVKRATARWRACMRGRGYDYADPFAAVGDTRWQSPDISATERATASADVDCKQRTGLAGTMFAVERAYQERAIAQNSAHLRALRAYQATTLANADRTDTEAAF